MTTNTNTETLLFLGATGGTMLSCLAHTLYSAPSNIHCIALARTPKKLLTLLEKTLLLTPEQYSPSRLTILTGNATDPIALQKALLYNPNSTTSTPQLPSTILFGIGGLPSLAFNPSNPLSCIKLDQPTICHDAAQALVSALRKIYTDTPSTLTTEKGSGKPRVVFLSTTGISQGAEDVPVAMRWLYHWVLREPHVDKVLMEACFRKASAASSAEGEAVFSSTTGIRPTLLTGETAALSTGTRGWEALRAGTEAKPALGYSVARADVGEWIWEAVLRRVVAEGERSVWEGEMVSLTN